MLKNIKHLVVDTTAFIKAANLQDISENIYTVQEVVDEITNDRQRRKLVVLPYDLKVKDVFTENIKFVTEFSKKTGDYTSLSATDIKVMALTYQLEKENVSGEHLKSEPTMQRTVKVTGLSQFNLKPEDKDCKTNSNYKNEDNTNRISISEEKTHVTEEKIQSEPKNFNVTEAEMNSEEHKSKHAEKLNKNDDQNLSEVITDQIKNMDINVDDVMVKVSDSPGGAEEESEEYTDEDEESESDGDDWITPSNLAQKKKEVEMGEFEEKSVEVACITSDFAMQNVMKQIGLNVTSIDGRIIRQLRTFIFRCTTCFKTTSVMTKLFCPKCGHSTLKKVAVSVDDEGNQHIHINGRKPLTAKGKRFSLPTPRGGQHFQYPILSEDQHIHRRFATKLARNKTNALDPDYIAGFSPFVMKDVNSKSAVLGVRANKQDIKYWMKHHSTGKK